MEVVNTENNPKITYEHKELVLDMIVRFYKMPDFITELYVNYDCDLYTHNIFEDITKVCTFYKSNEYRHFMTIFS